MTEKLKVPSWIADTSKIFDPEIHEKVESDYQINDIEDFVYVIKGLQIWECNPYNKNVVKFLLENHKLVKSHLYNNEPEFVGKYCIFIFDLCSFCIKHDIFDLFTEIKSKWSMSHFFDAISYNRIAFLELLCSHLKYNPGNLLIYSVKKNNLDCIKFFVNKGFKINYHIIMETIFQDNVEILSYCLDNVYSYPKNIVNLAFEQNSVKCLEYVLAKKLCYYPCKITSFALNVTDECFNIAMKYNVKFDKKEIIKLISENPNISRNKLARLIKIYFTFF